MYRLSFTLLYGLLYVTRLSARPARSRRVFSVCVHFSRIIPRRGVETVIDGSCVNRRHHRKIPEGCFRRGLQSRRKRGRAGIRSTKHQSSRLNGLCKSPVLFSASLFPTGRMAARRVERLSARSARSPQFRPLLISVIRDDMKMWFIPDQRNVFEAG